MRPQLTGRLRLTQAVSIHAPREGCDSNSIYFDVAVVTFQFTHPGRGATLISAKTILDADVSIHAPREGCDVSNFTDGLGDLFQFTHPGRGATVWCKVAYYGADKQA